MIDHHCPYHWALTGHGGIGVLVLYLGWVWMGGYLYLVLDGGKFEGTRESCRCLCVYMFWCMHGLWYMRVSVWCLYSLLCDEELSVYNVS